MRLMAGAVRLPLVILLLDLKPYVRAETNSRRGFPPLHILKLCGVTLREGAMKALRLAAVGGCMLLLGSVGAQAVTVDPTHVVRIDYMFETPPPPGSLFARFVFTADLLDPEDG